MFLVFFQVELPLRVGWNWMPQTGLLFAVRWVPICQPYLQPSPDLTRGGNAFRSIIQKAQDPTMIGHIKIGWKRTEF